MFPPVIFITGGKKMKYLLKLATAGREDTKAVLKDYLYRLNDEDITNVLRQLEYQKEVPSGCIIVEDGQFGGTIHSSTLSFWTKKMPCIVRTGKEPINLYVDMDGTVAEYNKFATPEQVFSKGYFATRPMLINIIKALDVLYNCKGHELNINIITRCDMHLPWCREDKEQWLDNCLPFIEHNRRIFIPLEYLKTDSVKFKRRSDVLIDDWNRELQTWHGVSVKMLNGINSPWNGKSININDNVLNLVNEIVTYAGLSA